MTTFFFWGGGGGGVGQPLPPLDVSDNASMDFLNYIIRTSHYH